MACLLFYLGTMNKDFSGDDNLFDNSWITTVAVRARQPFLCIRLTRRSNSGSKTTLMRRKGSMVCVWRKGSSAPPDAGAVC